MRKQPEVEDSIKGAIRDELAFRPLLSTRDLQSVVFLRGFHSANGGFLDWHYVAKLARKVRLENIAKLSQESRYARLAKVKERHRRLTDKLAEIAVGVFSGASPRERIAAANTIMKWDMALLFAEEQISSIDHLSIKSEAEQITKTVKLLEMTEKINTQKIERVKARIPKEYFQVKD
jgi:hypothetical protein